MTERRLLKSWATPPARRVTASRRCEWMSGAWRRGVAGLSRGGGGAGGVVGGVFGGWVGVGEGEVGAAAAGARDEAEGPRRVEPRAVAADEVAFAGEGEAGRGLGAPAAQVGQVAR